MRLFNGGKTSVDLGQLRLLCVFRTKVTEVSGRT